MTSIGRRLGVLSLLLAVVYVEWQLIPVPGVQRVVARPSEAWELPRVPAAEPRKAAEILARTAPWGRLPESGEPPSLNPPGWRILGIFARGAERVVLVKVEKLPEQQLKAGDELPGGSRILEIRDDSLCVLVEGRKRKLGIYPRGPQAL